MLREHIHQFYTNLNPEFSDLEKFLSIRNDDPPKISIPSIKQYIYRVKEKEMPNSVDELDISKSFALIKNIFMGNDFGYSQDKYEYVDQLRKIRNDEYGHMLIFETDDIDFKLLSFEKDKSFSQLALQHFEELIQEMKGNEESRNLMLQVNISEMNSTLSKIKSCNLVNFKLNCIEWQFICL